MSEGWNWRRGGGFLVHCFHAIYLVNEAFPGHTLQAPICNEGFSRSSVFWTLVSSATTGRRGTQAPGWHTTHTAGCSHAQRQMPQAPDFTKISLGKDRQMCHSPKVCLGVMDNPDHSRNDGPRNEPVKKHVSACCIPACWGECDKRAEMLSVLGDMQPGGEGEAKRHENR